MSQRLKAACCWGLHQLRHLLPGGAVMRGCQSPCYHTPPQKEICQASDGGAAAYKSPAGHRKGQPVAAQSMHGSLFFFFFIWRTPWENNQHPLTRESWWCSLCCRQTRRRGWCWLLCGRPSAWPSRGLWYHRNSQSRRGSSQNWKTQN